MHILEDFLSTFLPAGASLLLVFTVFFAIPALGRDKLQRIHLSTFRTMDGEDEKAVELENISRAHLDIGVEEVSDGAGRQCKILTPKKTKESEEKWTPLDFYSELRAADAKKYAKELGKPDFFFEGDDFNRNDRGDSHKQTRELAESLRDTLDFEDKKPQSDVVDIKVTFQRGENLKFKGLMHARAFEVSDGCDAGLFYCPKPSTVDGKEVCDADGWTRITGIDAVVDKGGYIRDFASIYRLKEKDRNDVYSLVALTIGPKEEIGTAEVKRLVLATKRKAKEESDPAEASKSK